MVRQDRKTVIRMLPTAIAGFVLALWVDHLMPATEFKHLIEAYLTLVLVVMHWSLRKDKESMLAGQW